MKTLIAITIVIVGLAVAGCGSNSDTAKQTNTQKQYTQDNAPALDVPAPSKDAKTAVVAPAAPTKQPLPTH